MPGAAAAAAGDAEGDVREGPHTCCGGRTRGSSSLQHRAWGTDWSAVVWTSPWALRCSSLAHALPSFLPRRVRPTAAHLPGATSHQAGGVGLWHTSTRNLIPFYSDLCSAEMRLSHFLSQGGASSALGSRKPLLPSLPAHTPRAGAAHARAAPRRPRPVPTAAQSAGPDSSPCLWVSSDRSVAPVEPAVTCRAQSETCPVDSFVLSKLADHGGQPAPHLGPVVRPVAPG